MSHSYSAANLELAGVFPNLPRDDVDGHRELLTRFYASRYAHEPQRVQGSIDIVAVADAADVAAIDEQHSAVAFNSYYIDVSGDDEKSAPAGLVATARDTSLDGLPISAVRAPAHAAASSSCACGGACSYVPGGPCVAPSADVDVVSDLRAEVSLLTAARTFARDQLAALRVAGIYSLVDVTKERDDSIALVARLRARLAQAGIVFDVPPVSAGTVDGDVVMLRAAVASRDATILQLNLLLGECALNHVQVDRCVCAAEYDALIAERDDLARWRRTHKGRATRAQYKALLAARDADVGALIDTQNALAGARDNEATLQSTVDEQAVELRRYRANTSRYVVHLRALLTRTTNPTMRVRIARRLRALRARRHSQWQ